MAEAVDQAQHEFWRAPMPGAGAGAAIKITRDRTSTCRCGTEYIVSSLYCHSCGVSRPDLNTTRALEIPGVAELLSLGHRLGLTVPSLASFLIGILCVVGAVSVSVFFSVRTVLDWQAIQMWRIEWLVAAVASFLAGILLKK